MRHARTAATALVLFAAMVFALPSIAAAEGTFTNDFTIGQPLDTTNLATSASGGGTAVVSAGSLSLTTPAAADSALCYYVAPVAKGQASSYATRFRLSSLNDGGSLGVLDLHTGTTPPGSSATRRLSGRIVRVGVTYGFQLMRVGTTGATTYYNFANATWGTLATKFSLQPGVTYIIKFETNASGQFRWVVCSQSGTPLVNGTTVWTAFSTVLDNATNTYWPFIGDADASGAGRLDVLSISGPASTPPAPDTTPPTVAVTAPTDGATVAGLVSVTAAASDTGSGIARVEFRADGTLIGVSTGPSYTATWDARLAAPGDHVLQATAYDTAGNSASSSVSVRIAAPDTTTPAVAMVSPLDGAVVSGIVGLSASATDAESGVARVEFRVDGVLVGTDTTSPYGANWDATTSLGVHSVEAKAIDVAGNSATATVGVLVVDTLAPTVSILAPANGATVSGSVTIQASAADAGSGVARVEFIVDGSSIATDDAAPYAATWDASGASSGSHAIQALATDAAGNTATASVTVVVPAPDTTPPTVSILLPSEGATVTGTVYIAANAGDVGSGMSRVEFFVDDVPVGVSYRHMYVASWDSSAAAPGAHVIRATAFDLAGNSASATVTVNVPDQTPPSVALTTPADGSDVSGIVPIDATAVDANSGIDRVEFRVDGALLASDSTAPYSTTWDSSSALPGTHVVTATAFDAAGNSAAATVRVRTPDAVPPAVSITSPAEGATVSGATAVSATASDVGWGVAYVEFAVDGSVVGTDSASPYGVTWDAAAASPGSHTITATAVDAAGNSATATVTVTVSAADVTPPTVVITAPADGATVSSMVTISAIASDSESGVGGVQFRVDGTLVFSDTLAPYLAVWDATGATAGAHTITARAYDLAGNAATATVSVTVPPPPASGTFTNDFTLGQPLNLGYLGTSTVGAGTVTMTGSSLVLSTATNPDAAICSFRNSVTKTAASSYAVKFRVSSLSDGGSLGVMDLHTGAAPPTDAATRYLSASIVRSGVTYGLQISRVGADGATRYYNFANATWGTLATKFSIQPGVTYVLKMDTSNLGQFRYVMCSQAGNALVNGTTVWTYFSTVYNDAGNVYWPYIGDAYPNGFGTLEVFSIAGR